MFRLMTLLAFLLRFFSCLVLRFYSRFLPTSAERLLRLIDEYRTPLKCPKSLSPILLGTGLTMNLRCYTE